MSNKLAYYNQIMLFLGIALTTFGMFILGYLMGIGGERKAMGIVFSILAWYIGLLFLCEASSYKIKNRRKRK